MNRFRKSAAVLRRAKRSLAVRAGFNGAAMTFQPFPPRNKAERSDLEQPKDREVRAKHKYRGHTHAEHAAGF